MGEKQRPALVFSPDDMNAALPRVIVAPITSKGQPLGCRPEIVLDGKSARILLDQVCCVDKKHLAGVNSGRLSWPCGTQFCWKCWREQLERKNRELRGNRAHTTVFR